MSMTNMRITRTEHKQSMVCDPCCDADAPAYPYGLSIYLDQDALAKLGITELPSVGGKLTMTAVVEVTSVSQHESVEGGERKDVSMQITDMSIDSIVPQQSAASLLYPAG